MGQTPRVYQTYQRYQKLFTWGDLVILVGVGVVIYIGAQLAFGAPKVIRGPDISLNPRDLPWYALLSFGRMLAAYTLSILFTIFYGRTAAYNRRAERVMIPLLDVLQSVPILSFLPVVLLSLSAFLPLKLAVELASIVLIFTSQAWNLTFAWYQALTTIPKELREASAIYRLNSWFRFRHLEMPFAIISLVWNSMMSWAGGWFFLMAAEIFTVGNRDFRLPGLGTYLQEAASKGDFRAVGWGVASLVLLVVILDQLVWRPLLAWSERFKIEMVESDNPPTSWFYNMLHESHITSLFYRAVVLPVSERVDHWTLRGGKNPAGSGQSEGDEDTSGKMTFTRRLLQIFQYGLYAILAYGALRAVQFMLQVTTAEWAGIGLGVLATLSRVVIALLIALAWTIPVGVLIGTNPRLATFLQPLVQIAASVPATALFPVFLLFLLSRPGGLDFSAVLLMLTGTQWYLLFNVIAGASAIPQDLKYTATLMQLKGWDRWRRLIFPALFPYLVTGAITASGGAWNASIVAERTVFRGQVLETMGIGSIIAQATASGNYPVLLAATLSMITAVVVINRLVWRRMYRLAEEKYRME